MEEKPPTPNEQPAQGVAPEASAPEIPSAAPPVTPKPVITLTSPFVVVPVSVAIVAGVVTTAIFGIINSNRCGSLEECLAAESSILAEEGFSSDYFAALTKTANTMGDNVKAPYIDIEASSPLNGSHLTNNYLNVIPYEDFVGEHGDYIDKLSVGSFATTDGHSITLAEEDVGFSCEVLGVENYLVDFTSHEPPHIDHLSVEVRDSQGEVIRRDGADPANTGATDQRSREEKAAMLQNTIFLQMTNYCAPTNTNLVLPRGTYYFAIGHHRENDLAYTYVIKPKDGVSISGSGIGAYADVINNKDVDSVASVQVDGGNATILKPYTDATFYRPAAPDMFYYNNYAETPNGEKASIPHDDMYISNIHYENFIVDGADAVGYSYTSAGKGFMYNGFENVTWDYVVVKNTDGTGFGVDLPMGNSYIDHCLALYNGKKTNPSDGGEYPGGSGFGIGTGYSNQEKFTIRNSIAYGNGKFGFFYEHQNRFSPEPSKCQNNSNTQYDVSYNSDCYQSGAVIHDDIVNHDLSYPYAAIAAGQSNDDVNPSDNQNQTGTAPNIYHSSDAFVVENSVSANNLFNYGGMRTYDAKFADSVSRVGCVTSHPGTYYQKETCTKSNIYLSKDSRRVTTEGMSVDINFKDVTDSDKWYYDAVKWGIEHAVTYGDCERRKSNGAASVCALDSDINFGVETGVDRGQMITMIWRMMGYPGYVVAAGNNNQGGYNTAE